MSSNGNKKNTFPRLWQLEVVEQWVVVQDGDECEKCQNDNRITEMLEKINFYLDRSRKKNEYIEKPADC